METAIVDTGVWYAMVDNRDPNHKLALEKAELLTLLTIAVPWPVAYETLRTRLVRNKPALTRFETLLKSPGIEFVADDPFRDGALALALESSLRRSRPLSMADCLIRLMIGDVNTRVGYLATFN